MRPKSCAWTLSYSLNLQSGYANAQSRKRVQLSRAVGLPVAGHEPPGRGSGQSSSGEGPVVPDVPRMRGAGARMRSRAKPASVPDAFRSRSSVVTWPPAGWVYGATSIGRRSPCGPSVCRGSHVNGHLRSVALVEVLARWALVPSPNHLQDPSRRQPRAAFGAVVEAMRM